MKAVITLKNTSEHISLQDVRDFCEEKLAHLKIPKQIELVDELPRNTTGKIFKTVLRSETIENTIN
ncbi:hypothetical protein CSV72_15175 [Sporosarcina sp. P20a]|uniref:AMP-binding enzyme n=1 Tax=Sporosarcina sp. P20a TaxID=2048256 RepID=UPI000C168B39|nr:hypothetical protein CSV72_15175 [Sporosarcina sp. P20a]